MNVEVQMKEEEFLEFIQWKQDRKKYLEEAAFLSKKLEMFAKKVCWALENDRVIQGRIIIIDQDHASELLEMAKDYLA